MSYSDILESYKIANESYFFSKKDTYINFDKFQNDQSNICLITGFSGSGKSTLARNLVKKYNAVYIELDLFEQTSIFETLNDVRKNAGEVFYQYFIQNSILYQKIKNQEIRGTDLGKEIIKFLEYTMQFCLRNTSTKCIIEGIQIYQLLDIEKYKDIPLIIKNTSAIKSVLRQIKREYEEENTDKVKKLLSTLKQYIKPQLIQYIIREETALQEFKDRI